MRRHSNCHALTWSWEQSSMQNKLNIEHYTNEQRVHIVKYYCQIGESFSYIICNVLLMCGTNNVPNLSTVDRTKNWTVLVWLLMWNTPHQLVESILSKTSHQFTRMWPVLWILRLSGDRNTRKVTQYYKGINIQGF